MIKKQSKGIVANLIWSFAERILSQLVSTVVTIVLARLLLPEDYGVVSIVTVLISFMNIFVVSGFSTALVQKKDIDEIDINTAFWLSFCVSWILYIALFLFAPLVAEFYEILTLTPVIRVMAIQLPITSIHSIQQAKVQRAMEFKKFFKATIAATLFSGVLGVVLAYYGAGIWALVAQYTANVSIATLSLFFVDEWRPKFQFSFQKLKNIWAYGSKILMTQLVYTLEGDVRSLIVGKKFGTADLAYYDQGRKYPMLLVGNVSTTIDKVMLPAYAKQQDDKQQLLQMLRRSIRIGIYMLSPILLGFAAVSETFVEVFLTEKWLFAVPYMQIFCISYLTRPLESSCHQALLAIEKSGEVLLCMIAINGTGLITVFISAFIFESVMAIALFSILTTLISIVVFLFLINKHFGYTLKEQISDVAPSILMALCMSVAVSLVGMINIHSVLSLVIQVVAGAVVYVALSIVFKMEQFNYLIKFIRRKG